MKTQKVAMPCCTSMTEAVDLEIIDIIHMEGNIKAIMHMPTKQSNTKCRQFIKFCPWCGVIINEKK